ncbi:hypothetical protein ACIPY5_12125 [Microbacterium sp. NPDC089698]|uniref:hypothetical protein n=1 Tax=Microbacterium sp. NPDC089698 TaxID=3364200 RepID=UPI0038303043
MNIIRKDATIEPVGSDDDFPGKFRVILSAPTQDRDGDTLLPNEWKQPLPDHITFDADHGMSVASTVGSGTPSIDPETGNLIVDGTYSSIPRAQEVRTLVNEGHIRTTSVAFMTVPAAEKGAAKQRELLNGAFVAIPSNREALVLDSKTVKAGARNSGADLEQIQGIHDAATALGADCGLSKSVEARSFVEAKDAPIIDYSLVQAADAAVDAALNLLSTMDTESVPPEVAQAIALIQAADAAVDEFLEAAGLEDPDEDAEPAGESADPMAGAKSPAVGSVEDPAGDADSKAAPTPATVRLRLEAFRHVTDVV